MPETFGSRYYRGQGKLFIGDRDANGQPINLKFVGDLASASLTPQVERSEVIENTTGSNGTAASWLKSAKYNLSLALRSVDPAHLREALQGANTAKAGASVTDEAHTCMLGAASPLAHTNVSSVVVTGAGGTPTYVADTDYVVHGPEGMIEWLSGGTITDALSVLIDYDYAAQHHVSASPNNAQRYLVFAGKNSADGDKQTRCEIFKCKLDPGALDLITDEAADMQIGGVVEQDSARAPGDQFFTWKLQD